MLLLLEVAIYIPQHSSFPQLPLSMVAHGPKLLPDLVLSSRDGLLGMWRLGAPWDLAIVRWSSSGSRAEEVKQKVGLLSWTSRESTLIFFKAHLEGSHGLECWNVRGLTRAWQHLNSTCSKLKIRASLRVGNWGREIRDNVGPLLNKGGVLVMGDAEKVEMLNSFFASAFTSVSAPRVSWTLEGRERAWESKSFSLVVEGVLPEHLGGMHVHKSMGLDGMLRELAEEIAKPLSVWVDGGEQWTSTTLTSARLLIQSPTTS